MSKRITPILITAAASISTGFFLYYWFLKKFNRRNTFLTPSRSITLPIIDISTHFNKDSDSIAYSNECKRVAQALHDFGVCIIRDPRVNEEDNNNFLSMMERYFEVSDGKRDSRPQYDYQVGVTPSNIEKPRSHCHIYGAYTDRNVPLSPCPPELDPKWRFFWRVGSIPKKTKFPTLNMDPVIPVS